MGCKALEDPFFLCSLLSFTVYEWMGIICIPLTSVFSSVIYWISNGSEEMLKLCVCCKMLQLNGGLRGGLVQTWKLNFMDKAACLNLADCMNHILNRLILLTYS